MSFLSKDSYGIPVLLAVGLHTVIIVFSIVGVDFDEASRQKTNEKPIVQAKVVDIDQTVIGQRIRDEKKKIADAKAAKKRADQKKKEQARKKELAEKQKKIEQARKVKQAKKEQEMKKAAEKKALLEKQKKEKAKKDNEKRLKEIAAQKKAKQEAEAEELAKKQQEETRKKEAARIAEEKQKRQEEARKNLEKERKRAEQLAAEKAIEAEAKRQRDAEERQAVQSLTGLIESRIRNNWIRPPDARNGMKTGLRIRFLPNGEVSEVFITQSSGDSLFDKRTVDAVHKVERIEELADLESYIFERNFRTIDIIFNPQDLRN